MRTSRKQRVLRVWEKVVPAILYRDTENTHAV